MYTNELSALIQQSKPGWSRPNDVIPLIRDVVNILCKVENDRFLIIDPTTGRPPLLSTTANNFGPYNGPSGSWRVAEIMLKEPAYDYTWLLDYDTQYGERPYINSTNRISINGNWYYPCQFVKTEDALEADATTGENGLPKIYFSRNPETVSDRWYMKAYRKPPQITSDRIQLPIPDSYGCHRLYVLPACLTLIEAIDHGNYQNGLTYIETVIKPKMWHVLNKGATRVKNRVQPRPY